MILDAPSMFDLLKEDDFEEFLSSRGLPLGNPLGRFSKSIYRTGATMVFCGAYVFKFLPGRFPLAERRRQFEIEIAHQRLFDPERRISLGCFPVVIVDGQPRIVDDGATGVVDYVLLMHRIAHTDAFLARAASGSLAPDFEGDFAGTLAQFHDRCDVVRTDEQIAEVVSTEIAREARDVSEALRLVPALGASLSGLRPNATLNILSEVRTILAQTTDARRDMLSARGRAGWIRDIHGDLHAENWWIVCATSTKK